VPRQRRINARLISARRVNARRISALGISSLRTGRLRLRGLFSRDDGPALWAQPIEPSRFRAPDLVSEALAGILQRPGRSVLTMLGTVLGIGAFTAILGLTSTTSGQISTEFTVLAATQVTLKDVGDAAQLADPRMYDFPPNADAEMDALHGVVHAGVTWPVFEQPPAVSSTPLPSGGQSQQIAVQAASPGYLQALDPTLKSGTLYNSFHDQRRLRVAVIGSAVASELGIGDLSSGPAIFVNGVGYTVIGVLGSTQRAPDVLLKVLIPDQTATEIYGQPASDNPASMLIETRLGAAPLIARQAALALRPDHAALLQAVPPPDPNELRNQVAGNLNSLFLLLAAITLVIGAVGIANTTLVAVLERIAEIGLRRSLGARPRHVAGQFLAESTALGTLGGLIGTALGIAVTVLVAVLHHWTAVLNPATTLPAPLIGTAIGLFAGLYPALRAARVEPAEALRR
jgi:putative ABC transport system permease protein